MKKIILVFAIVVLFLSGCSIYRVDNLDYSSTVDLAFKSNAIKPNTALSGYKIYLPRNIKTNDKTGTNQILYSNGQKLYLYVDVISYHEQTTNDYDIKEIKDNIIFSKEINIDGNNGYVLITEIDGKLFLQVMYNYAKIEAIVSKDNIRDTLYDSILILKSCTYNKIIIESLIGSNDFKEEVTEYKLLGPKSSSSTNFLNYLKEYDDVDNELPDNDVLDIDN